MDQWFYAAVVIPLHKFPLISVYLGLGVGQCEWTIEGINELSQYPGNISVIIILHNFDFAQFFQNDCKIVI